MEHTIHPVRLQDQGSAVGSLWANFVTPFVFEMSRPVVGH